MILALEGLTLMIEVTLRSQYHRLRITFVLLETFQYRKYSAANFSRFTQRIRHIVIYSIEKPVVAWISSPTRRDIANKLAHFSSFTLR